MPGSAVDDKDELSERDTPNEFFRTFFAMDGAGAQNHAGMLAGFEAAQKAGAIRSINRKTLLHNGRLITTAEVHYSSGVPETIKPMEEYHHA